MTANTNVITKVRSSNIKFKDSIKTKLISVLLVVAVIPLTIAVIVSYSTSTSKAKADALSLLESDAKVVEGKFSTLVQQNILALQTCASAQSTIEMWHRVRRGEERNIFPYQDTADAIFNSALLYELSVLKTYAEPALFNVEKDTEEYLEAKRLLKFLKTAEKK